MSHRTALVALGISLALALNAPAASPDKTTEKAKESLTYTPPAMPEVPAAGPLLLRLVLATAAVLAIGGAAAWGVRRLSARAPLAGADPRLRLVETLALGNGSYLYMLDCCGRRFVAGVSRSGLRSLTPLPEPFENELDLLAPLR